MKKIFAIYAKNIAVVFLEKATTIALGLLCTSLIARSLSVEDFGNFQYSLVLLNIFLSLTYFCGAEFLTPKITTQKSNSNKLITDAFFLRLSFSLISSLILIIYIIQAKTNILYIILLPLLIKETFSIALNWFQAHGKNYIPSKIQIFSSIIKTTIIYLLFAHEKISLDIALIMFFAEYCFTTILIFIIFKKESGFKIQKTSVNNILSLLKESWSFGIGIFFMMILQRIDKFYLKSRISEYEFGLYSAASQITENILVFFSVFITTISPLLIYNKDNYYQVKNSLLILIITTLFISLTIITLINTFSSEIFSLVFGEIYKASSSIFLKLSPLIIIYTLDLSISSYFNKFNMGKTIMKKWIISFSTSFFLLGINNDANIDYSIISITLGYLLGFLYSLFSFKMKDNKLK